MTYTEYEEHCKRNFVIVLTCCIIGAVSIHFLIFQPEYDKIARDEKNDLIKSQQEYVQLTSMDCKDLGNSLLLNNFFNKTNLIWAQNHYLVNCH